MIVFPNAKINLGLSVVRKREDGYHDLETVFYPVGLSDILELLPAEGDSYSFENLGNALDCDDKNNLVVKAFFKLKGLYNIPDAQIYLKKLIPSGAGLGGGSSDATFTILALNELFSLNMTKEECIKISSELGADCPFFCINEPVYAQGTGNLFTPVKCSLSQYKLVIIKPDVFVSTKDAFANIIPSNPELCVKDIVENYEVEQWRDLLVNDFEKTVFAKFPQIELIKNKLYEQGALYSSMSGSGSSVFGIFNSVDNILRENLQKEFHDCFIWIQD